MIKKIFIILFSFLLISNPIFTFSVSDNEELNWYYVPCKNHKIPEGSKESASFIKDYDSQTYDTSKLDLIINLRNSVMHHSLLLFDYNFESTVDEALKGINALVEMLPSDYKDGCIKNLKVPNQKTKENIASTYYKFLLYKED